MMGPEDDKGVIPRLCETMFQYINDVGGGRRSVDLEQGKMWAKEWKRKK